MKVKKIKKGEIDFSVPRSAIRCKPISGLSKPVIEEDWILESTEVRPTVYWYAQRMEMRLREKDATRGKDGWHDGKLPYYIERAMVCLYTIAQTLKTGKDSKEYIGIECIERLKEKDIHFLIKKCIDGGNFLMMLADNLRDELVKRGIPQDGK